MKNYVFEHSMNMQVYIFLNYSIKVHLLSGQMAHELFVAQNNVATFLDQREYYGNR